MRRARQAYQVRKVRKQSGVHASQIRKPMRARASARRRRATRPGSTSTGHGLPRRARPRRGLSSRIHQNARRGLPGQAWLRATRAFEPRPAKRATTPSNQSRQNARRGLSSRAQQNARRGLSDRSQQACPTGAFEANPGRGVGATDPHFPTRRPATRQLRPRPALATATRARSQTPGRAQGAPQTLAGGVPQRRLYVFLYSHYSAHIMPK